MLNVWTPALRDQRRRPVMVWLHGGGFSAGSGSRNVFEGTRLCQRGDVVVVTLNHRLSVFGFLYLGHLGGAEYAESGNAGMLDLVAALRWVHDNISAFGGDPGNVTIFGQSGGAAKVSTLMAMPQARGLFHKAIVQSGSHLDGLTPDEATRHALTFLAAVDVKPTELARLAKVPTDKLVAGLAKVMAVAGPGPNYSPVVDGIVLPRNPWQPDGPAVSAGIPMMVGSTRTETTALLGAGYFGLDAAGLVRSLAGWIPDRDIPRVVAGFKALMPSASAADLFFAITTDRRVRQQAWAQAERKAAQGAGLVWLYELDWATPVDGGKWGSPHALDLAFVFDNVAKSEAMVGSGAEPSGLAEQMSSAWIAFARTGRPDTGAAPAWPAFTLGERATMVFDVQSLVVNDFRREERALLAALINQKYAVVMSGNLISKDVDAEPKPIIEKTNDTKLISSYTCKRAKVSYADKKIPGFDIWYTTEIDIKNPNWSNPYHEIEGVLMEYQLKRYGLELRFTCTSVSKASIDDAVFELPSEYKIITREEMDKKFEGF